MTYASLKTVAIERNLPELGLEPKRRGGRRALVLTDEAAQHSFRASLPPHVRSDELAAPAESLWQLTRDDVRGFATVYVSTFAAIIAFIA